MTREAEVPVVFRPLGQTAYVLPGTRLIEAAAASGMAIDFPCGGQGTCGKCRVHITQGAAAPNAAERWAIAPEDLSTGHRLACQAVVAGPTEVEMPTAVAGSIHQILASRTAGDVALQPAVRKLRVELPAPRRGDDEPDLLRLERAIGPFRPALTLARRLSVLLRDNDFRGTAVLLGDRLIDFETDEASRPALAVAVDLGTTTLVAALVDLTTGEDIAITSRINPQTRFGDDVLSRINHVVQEPGSLPAISALAAAAVDEMIGELCRQATMPREAIYEVCLAGNTTMEQLFCQIDPRPLGSVPFAPTMGRGVTLAASDVGLGVHPAAEVYVLPVIGGFVGGDTVAGLLATDICTTPGPTLLVDIGTNGEIVLWANGRLSAASTAAGPAFEGARIKHGMRGSRGAIEKVVVDGRLRINVIGNVPPEGICGSGLIDAAAELLRFGMLSPQGRLLPPDQLPAETPLDLQQRLVTCDRMPAVLVAAAEETANGRPIVLTQRDFRELQLATGAIRAGTEILLRRAGLRPADLDAVLIGGGFGNFIRRNNAQRIGLLPPAVEHVRMRYRGNTSLAGARLAALSLAMRQKGEELARQTEHVDLSTDADFRNAFAEAMLFPEE